MDGTGKSEERGVTGRTVDWGEREKRQGTPRKKQLAEEEDRVRLEEKGATADWATPSSTTSLAGPMTFPLASTLTLQPRLLLLCVHQHSMATLGSSLNYGFPPEMGMVDLREFVVVTPASFSHHHTQDPIVANDQFNGTNAPTPGFGVIPLLTATRSLAPQSVEDLNIEQQWSGDGGGMGGWSGVRAQLSTWVPARRRERQIMAAGAAAAGLSGSTAGPKKLRLTITGYHYFSYINFKRYSP
ncbi:hypothetical protein F3Y22_tig00002793pilonHSYRG00094 [Hibiscus syriacus]|uniref:Uncharacterized protein n=1 Tax=Hibiscus syriacus TaxID=106335 RepID=A0A6A3CWS8_HIBSY|nr:hypothetical protein F3Y22_tig00002793pilonHSYRG00094 [Hibiscus syriacus]